MEIVTLDGKVLRVFIQACTAPRNSMGRWIRITVCHALTQIGRAVRRVTQTHAIRVGSDAGKGSRDRCRSTDGSSGRKGWHDQWSGGRGAMPVAGDGIKTARLWGIDRARCRPLTYGGLNRPTCMQFQVPSLLTGRE